MSRLVVMALVAFLLPAIVFYVWRVFAPPRFGGSHRAARGEWIPLPWRWLFGCGLVLMIAMFVALVILPLRTPARPVVGSARAGQVAGFGPAAALKSAAPRRLP